MREFDMQEIHEISVGMLGQLEDDEVDVAHAAVATAMSFGRLVSPAEMNMEQEMAFIDALMNFGTMYFVEGTPQ